MRTGTDASFNARLGALEEVRQVSEDRSICNDSRKSTGRLLRGLRSADPGPFWAEFLDRYAQLIMSVADQFEYEHSRISDCFVYVCEQLNDDGFRRLLKFNSAGKARFRTWLGAVVFNLCVDWHRREYGRATLLPAIAALPAFDRSVYHLVIEQGMGKEQCFQTLKADFPDLTRDLVAKAAGRVYSLLTPRQRWQLCVRNRRRTRSLRVGPGQDLEQFPDPAAGPETESHRRQQIDALNIALSGLSPEQRLLLRLRYQEGLTLREIARMKKWGDINQAWRKIQAATSALATVLDSGDIAKKRKI
jgi:RNA polymerase sigma factor (sigma-70 family)